MRFESSDIAVFEAATTTGVYPATWVTARMGHGKQPARFPKTGSHSTATHAQPGQAHFSFHPVWLAGGLLRILLDHARCDGSSFLPQRPTITAWFRADDRRRPASLANCAS